MASLGIHTKRLGKQRVKQKQKSQPMTKHDVCQKKLDTYVLHDEEAIQTFTAWWKSLTDDETVEVQYLHGGHGLDGRYRQYRIQDNSK